MSDRRQDEGFLFTFISIAYAMSVTEVFPVLFETVGQGWHYVRDLPILGRLGTVTAENLLLSPRHYSLAAPYLDKVALAFFLLFLWMGYFFLIARMRHYAEEEYGPFHMVGDLAQAILFFFAARSLRNFDEKLMPDADTTWLLLVLILLVQHARIIGSFRAMGPPRPGELVRVQMWGRLLVRLAHLNAMTVGLVCFGWLFNIFAISLGGTQRAALWAIAVYFALVLVAVGVLARVRNLDRGESYRPIQSCLGWAWRKEWGWMAMGLVGCGALYFWLETARSSYAAVLLCYREGLPLSVLCALGVVPAAYSVYSIGDVPFLGKKTLRSMLKMIVRDLAAHMDRTTEERPLIALLWRDRTTGRCHVIATANDGRRWVRNAIGVASAGLAAVLRGMRFAPRIGRFADAVPGVAPTLLEDICGSVLTSLAATKPDERTKLVGSRVDSRFVDDLGTANVSKRHWRRPFVAKICLSAADEEPMGLLIMMGRNPHDRCFAEEPLHDFEHRASATTYVYIRLAEEGRGTGPGSIVYRALAGEDRRTGPGRHE